MWRDSLQESQQLALGLGLRLPMAIISIRQWPLASCLLVQSSQWAISVEAVLQAVLLTLSHWAVPASQVQAITTQRMAVMMSVCGFGP